MDPSGFNLNRIGNAMKAREDWKNGKRRGPRSLWGPVLVIIIIGIVLFLVFHPFRQRTNWTVLNNVPSTQAQKVKKTVRKVKYQLKIPTKLPFKATGANAFLTSSGSYSQTIELKLKNNVDAITERVTNAIPLTSNSTHGTAMKLPDGTSAVSGLNGQLPTLSWKAKGISYTLSITKWDKGSKPSVQKLIYVYTSMK